MKKNILLVYPSIPKNTYWSFSDSLKFVGKKTSMPPLGLITVAGMIPENYSLKLIDECIKPSTEKDFEWADIIFTSSMIVQKDSLDSLVERIHNFSKKNNKKIPIVAGGPYPTQYFDKIKGIDHFLIGEAESGILEDFLNDLDDGNPKKAYARKVLRIKEDEKKVDIQDYQNLIDFFGKEGDIKIIDNRPNIEDSPIPRFDLLDIRSYNSMAVQMSRGCPFNCDFCNEPHLFGHTPRLKSGKKMLEEFKKIYDLGHKGSLFIVDDNFIGNIKKAKSILKDIKNFQKERDYPFGLYTEASMNLAWDDELMTLMRDAGFNMVFMGIESPDEEVLASMNKGQNLKVKPADAVRKIQSYGIEITAGFIVGSDKDPENICDQIFDFCQETGIPTAMVGLLDAYPGSPFYERLKYEGRLREETSGNNTHDFSFNFEQLPEKDEKRIIEDYKNLLARLYDKDGTNYFKRCKVLIDNLGDHPKASRDVRWAEIRAFTLSILKQTMFKRYSSNYRKFVKYSAMNHKNRFPEAITKAIMGRHLIGITHTSLKADTLCDYLLDRYDKLSERIETALKEGWAESELTYNRIIKEKNAFLAKAKKKIKKFPPDYRPKLIETYKNISQSLENIIPKNYLQINKI